MVSHVKPDGDTLGAGLGLGIALKRLGKRVDYFQQDPVPRNLRFLPEAEHVSREIPGDLPADALWVFCDMSDVGRAGEHLPPIDRANILDIDHHLANTHFGALNYVLPAECSTGTCVIRLLRELDVPVDAAIATCLLTTVMTDTGGFMHSNTTPEVLELSAELMRAGADKEAITEEIFANKRVAATRLLGLIVDKMQFRLDGRYCYSYVDDAMLAAYRSGRRRHRRHGQRAARARGRGRGRAVQSLRRRDSREPAFARPRQRAGGRRPAGRRRALSRVGLDV